MRLFGQLLVIVMGLAAMVGIAFAIRGVFPAFFGLFRLLANPIVLAGAVAFVVLVRLGYPRRAATAEEASD